MKTTSLVFASLLLIASNSSVFAADTKCIGYAGPGGPCYSGPGGGAYTGPGGGLSTGPNNPWRRIPQQ
jgi:hypothetical protein